jgi:thioredoxin reductase (NADPH)
MRDLPWESLIVGGGPAGLAAALHLARAGYRVLLIERNRLGGQAGELGVVENYPGFPRDMTGRRLMDIWIRQARGWGAKTLRAEIKSITRTKKIFRAVASDGRAWRGRSVIYAPGAAFNPLGVPRETELRGIFHAAFGSAPRWRGKTVAVAGGGEAAAHQALNLARHARRVYLICRAPSLKAHRLLRGRLSSCARIAKVFGAKILALKGEKDLRTIVLQGDAGRLELEVDALFVLVGKSGASLPFSSSRLPPGFFVAGDARGDSCRQIVVAAGDGYRAAAGAGAFLGA